MLTNDKIAQPIPCYLTSNPSGGVDHTTAPAASAQPCGHSSRCTLFRRACALHVYATALVYFSLDF